MPKFKIVITDVEQKIVKGKRGIGRNLHFNFTSPSFTITHNEATMGKKPYLLAGELPIDAPTPIELAVNVVETDKIASDTGTGSVTFTVDPALGETPQMLPVPVKEDYGSDEKNKNAPEVVLGIHLLVTVAATDQEKNKEKADNFVPVLNKALDALWPTIDSNCHLDRGDTFDLLLNTANHESGCFNFVTQQLAGKKKGKGEGLLQMEPDTHDSLWKYYLSRTEHAKTAEALRRMVNVQSGTPKHALLKKNDCYAAAMALVRYLDHGAGTDGPVPHAGDLQQQSEYWGEHYQAGPEDTDEQKQVKERKRQDFRDHYHATFGPNAHPYAAPAPAPTSAPAH